MAKVFKAVRDVRNGYAGTYHVAGFAIGASPITVTAEVAEYIKKEVLGIVVFEDDEPDVSPEAVTSVSPDDEEEVEAPQKETVKKDGQGKRK